MRWAMKEIPKTEISETLSEFEGKYGLKKGTLQDIYDEEARVVFKGVRRNVIKNLRQILDGKRIEMPEEVQFNDNSED